VPKCLILLAFVSYEAVRLWWCGGNGGVVSFEKTDAPVRFRPSPPANVARRSLGEGGLNKTNLKNREMTGCHYDYTLQSVEFPNEHYMWQTEITD
jgi:hypothetical protein